MLRVQQKVAEKLTEKGVCLSGGAEGADLEWGRCASLSGHGVVHFVFAGHRSNAPQESRYVLSAFLLEKGEYALRKANQTLRRTYPTRSLFVNSLLQRNFYQIIFANSCYAVSKIDKSGRVAGGTAWAVQMFLDQCPGQPCYVYCQRQESWFSWLGDWDRLPEQPPAPRGFWTGVGSRDLTSAGTRAIQTLMGLAKE